MPGERVLSVEQSRMMDSIYRASNDNGVAQRIDELSGQVKRLTALTARATEMQIETQKDISKTNRAMLRHERRQAWRGG